MRRSSSSGRVGGSGAIPREMSYTNLAAMASGFESYQRAPPSGGRRGSGAVSHENVFSQAMELVNAGLGLDASRPAVALDNYQRGGDLLSSALESAPPSELSEKMQRTLGAPPPPAHSHTGHPGACLTSHASAARRHGGGADPLHHAQRHRPLAIHRIAERRGCAGGAAATSRRVGHTTPARSAGGV